jgi:hypothetical protein
MTIAMQMETLAEIIEPRRRADCFFSVDQAVPD